MSDLLPWRARKVDVDELGDADQMQAEADQMAARQERLDAFREGTDVDGIPRAVQYQLDDEDQLQETPSMSLDAEAGIPQEALLNEVRNDGVHRHALRGLTGEYAALHA